MTEGKLLVLEREGHILTLLTAGNRLAAVNACKKAEADGIQVGDIYLGKVQNIVKNIEAAFVEVSKGVLCYLSLSEGQNATVTNRPEFSGRLQTGDELIVQVEREAIKTKLPAVTARISLSGRYLALAQGSAKLGISGKLEQDKKQYIVEKLAEENLVDAKRKCRICEEMKKTPYGMIIRTNAGALQEDMTPLFAEWKALEEQYTRLMQVAFYRPCYTCLKKNPPAYLEGLKDFYREEYEEIVTDIPEIYEAIKNYAEDTMFSEQIPLRLYQDTQLPLAKLYSVESRLEEALASRIWLKSGGYLVIEPTEALTVIDVNTGKYDAKKGSLKDTCKKINLEAAKEIAWQLRLRNLSGIIIVDFINIEEKDFQEQLLSCLKNLVKKDPVHTTIIDMTPLGLVEITRKKINKPLKEQLRT